MGVNQRGLSLMELIVASLVSTIVIGGLFTVMQSMQNMSSSSGQGGYLAVAARVNASRIIADASQVVGFGTTAPDKGILIGTPDGLDNATFCFLQDASNRPDAVVDTAICYSQILSADRLTSNLYRCKKADVASVGKCVTSDENFELIGTIVPDTIVGTGASKNPTFPVAQGSNLFTITLTNRVDSMKVKSNTNQESTITSSIAPPGYRF